MKKIILPALAIMLLCGAPALAGRMPMGPCIQEVQKPKAADVALQVAALLGSNISITDSGDPIDSKSVADFVAGARDTRDDSDSWSLSFSKSGCYSAQIMCFRRNDARHFVVHAISKTFQDGRYELHSLKFYIFDGRKLMPVKDLPCSTPITDSDFTDGLGKYNFMNARRAAGAASPSDDDWGNFLKPSNMEYSPLNARTISVSAHNATPGHKTLELAWNGDKFQKRQGSMQIIHPSDFAGIYVGEPLPSGIDLGNVKLATINESVYMIRLGSTDIARIELKKGVIDCIIITAPGYTTPSGCGIGDKIDAQSSNFVARQGNDTFIDASGIQYRIDGNSVCREIAIKNQ